MPLTELRDIVNAVLPAVSADDITPTITTALFRLDKGNLTVLATDRYRVHRVRGTYKGSPAGDFLIPRAALKWISKNAGFFGRRAANSMPPHARLDITFEPLDHDPKTRMVHGPKGDVTITLSEAETPGAEAISYALPLVGAGFPPVGDLLDKAIGLEPEAASGQARLNFIADAKHITQDRFEPGKFKVVQPDPGGNKAAQLLIEFERGEALIQLRDGAKR